MLEIVKTINGVKRLVPLTTDSGQGLPLGAWTSFEDDQPRNGYLKAGTTFNQSEYPALYNMLGSNVVPERFDHDRLSDTEAITISNSSSNLTVMSMDGELYVFASSNNYAYLSLYQNGSLVTTFPVSGGAYSNSMSISFKKGDSFYYSGTGSFKVAYYKHPMFIKAVIGPIEDSAADQVVQNINNSRSYSTEEVNTGKTWIDGKPIYRKVFYSDTNWPNNTTIGTIANIENLCTISSYSWNYNNSRMYRDYSDGTNVNCASVNLSNGSVVVDRLGAFAGSTHHSYVVIEYTKTTD